MTGKWSEVVAERGNPAEAKYLSVEWQRGGPGGMVGYNDPPGQPVAAQDAAGSSTAAVADDASLASA
jgi:hypothetical protein